MGGPQFPRAVEEDDPVQPAADEGGPEGVGERRVERERQQLQHAERHRAVEDRRARGLALDDRGAEAECA